VTDNHMRQNHLKASWTPFYPSQWRRKHFKSGGTNSGAKRRKFFSTVPPPTFSWCPPMTGNYRKVHGTVTRTELGQRWPTVGGQSDLWLFKVMLCLRWPRQSIEHRAWVVSYRSSVDANSVSCCVSEYLNPQRYFLSI